MRFNYYFEVKGQQKYAMNRYHEEVQNRAEACSSCEGYCENACPYGVSTRNALAHAHSNLGSDIA
jgi:ferredoxin